MRRHSHHPAPPPISKHLNLSHCGPYMKNCWLFFPLLWNCLLYDEVLLPWKFGNPGLDVTRTPPNMITKIFLIFWIWTNKFYSDCCLISHVHRYVFFCLFLLIYLVCIPKRNSIIRVCTYTYINFII